MEITKGRKRLLEFARKELRSQARHQSKDNMYFGVRFMSDKMVNDKVKEGKSVLQALKELAMEDYKGL